ncbi:MAG: hypothetical protein ABIR96_08755 [Bdellovibrionota bacterium]
MKNSNPTSWILGCVLASTALLAAPKVLADELSPVQELKLAKRAEAIAILPSGLSLYTFDPDNGAAQPACIGTCAEHWAPVSVDAAEIVGDARLGTVTRASGVKQLTISGKPVYTFFMDRKSGDIKGDGLGNVWHLVELY